MQAKCARPRAVTMIAVLAAGVTVAGCAGNPNSAQIGQGAGMVTGAVVGGVIGEAVGGRGGRIAGILIGTAIGGMVGYEIGRSLSEPDRKIAHQRYALGLSQGNSGQTYSWANPASGAATNYTPQKQRAAEVTQRIVRPSAVQAPPSLTIIGDYYLPPKATEVRAAPAATGGVINKLAAKEKVMVMGQVEGASWYLVSRDGAAIGYVPVAALQPVKDAAPDATILTAQAGGGAVAPGYVEGEVRSKTTCRDMDYEVLLNGQKAEGSRFASCKAADGNWIVQAGQPQGAT